ncbi:MAG: SAM-dependent DNA methyltransferase [Limisphaerales bacterium]
MQTSPLPAKPIGAVFTPLRWARWLIDQANVVRRWADGATICDPTAGNGAFAYALVDTAITTGIEVDDKMLSRLYLLEQQPKFLRDFEAGFRLKYQREFPKRNLVQCDIILSNPKRRFDFLVGNPPWANFSDLPLGYKQATKPQFLQYGLVPDTQAVLLGSSRVDLAALVIAVVLNENLEQNGEAAFFLPLSLFFNDGAHSGFRGYRLRDSGFRVCQIWDFRVRKIFPEVLTRIGAALFHRDKQNAFPIPYKSLTGESWTSQYAAPIGEATAPLSISAERADLDDIRAAAPITVRAEQKPRQGVNTCGANHVFIFDQYPDHLPSQFVFPLLTKECFRTAAPGPQRFILLAYNTQTGSPLTEAELNQHPTLGSYLRRNRHTLENRKGSLLGAWIKRGIWWACLGVGRYSFAPHKVVWEAYGKHTFAPRVFSAFDGKPWQPNQAMHSFIPCPTAQEAESLLEQLRSSHIERYLKSLNVEGTCNWAQPGRIKRFLKFATPDPQRNRQLELV